MTYSEPRSICFVLFNIRIPAAHSAFILSHTSLGLALLPSRLIVCLSGPTRGRCGVRNFPLSVGLYLRVEYRLFPLLPLSGLFRCRFGLMVHTGSPLYHTLSSDMPWLPISPVISTNDFAYLPGLLAARPSAFAEGERFELPKRFAACLVSSEVLSSTQPTFLICLSYS